MAFRGKDGRVGPKAKPEGYKRWPHEVPGKILTMKDEGLTVVPYQWVGAEGYYCVVVESNNDSYPVGGYNILCFVQDLCEADERELKDI